MPGLVFRDEESERAGKDYEERVTRAYLPRTYLLVVHNTIGGGGFSERHYHSVLRVILGVAFRENPSIPSDPDDP